MEQGSLNYHNRKLIVIIINSYYRNRNRNVNVRT